MYDNLSEQILELFAEEGRSVLSNKDLVRGAGFQIPTVVDWHHNNREYLRQCESTYRKLNKARINATKKRWWAANAEKVNAARRAKTAAKKST